jgi:tetratricopeptide (TPR) repeat protein
MKRTEASRTRKECISEQRLRMPRFRQYASIIKTIGFIVVVLPALNVAQERPQFYYSYRDSTACWELILAGVQASAHNRELDGIILFNRAEKIASRGDLQIIWTFRGITYGFLEKYDNSIRDFSKIISLDTSGSGGYTFRLRGQAYNCIGKYDLALSDFNDALRFNPKDTSTYKERADCKFELHDFSGAVCDYSHSISLTPEKKELYFARGASYSMEKKYCEAIADYIMYLRYDNESSNALYALGYLYCLKGTYDSALIRARELIKKAPLRADLYYDIEGQVYLLTGKLDSAIQAYRLIIERDPEQWTAHLGLSLAYMQIDSTYSRRHFTEASRLEPRLAKGMLGIMELEPEGYLFSDAYKNLLNSLFLLLE